MTDDELTNHPAEPLSGWAKGLISLAIVAHLTAIIGGLALAASSGPWLVGDGRADANPPHFAQAIRSVALPYYLRFVRMTNNYHFESDDPALTATRLEAIVRDQPDAEPRTVIFPTSDAWFMARLRQRLLAERLYNDEQVMPLAGEQIAAPNAPIRTARFWEPVENKPGALRTVEMHLIPRDRPVFGPTEPVLILARSYGRHLLRRFGAASVELHRHSRDPISPDVMFLPKAGRDDAPAEELVTFGVTTEAGGQ